MSVIYPPWTYFTTTKPPEDRDLLILSDRLVRLDHKRSPR